MKALLTAVLFAFTCAMLLAHAAPSTKSSRHSSQAAVRGRRIFYEDSCAGCHDTQGTMKLTGPNLKGLYHRRPRPVDAQIRTLIQHGKGNMPAFNYLSNSQVNDLLAYLKSL